jgi:hypothetical protein
MERTWTENGWRTINRPTPRTERDAVTGEGWSWELLAQPGTVSASGREPSVPGSPAPITVNRYGVPINRRCLNMAAHKLAAGLPTAAPAHLL